MPKPEDEAAATGASAAGSSASGEAAAAAAAAQLPGGLPDQAHIAALRDSLARTFAEVIAAAGMKEVAALGLRAPDQDTWNARRPDVLELAGKAADEAFGQAIITAGKGLKGAVKEELGKTQDQFQIAEALRKRFQGVSRSQSRRLIRTLIRDLYNEATLNRLEASGVAEVEASDGHGGLSGVTDPECIARNGQRFTIAEARTLRRFHPTVHPNCTLSFRPVVPAEGLKPTLPEGAVQTLFGEAIAASHTNGDMLMLAWEPDLHPRWPENAPFGKGGEFMEVFDLFDIFSKQSVPSPVNLTFLAKGSDHIQSITAAPGSVPGAVHYSIVVHPGSVPGAKLGHVEVEVKNGSKVPVGKLIGFLQNVDQGQPLVAAKAPLIKGYWGYAKPTAAFKKKTGYAAFQQKVIPPPGKVFVGQLEGSEPFVMPATPQVAAHDVGAVFTVGPKNPDGTVEAHKQDAYHIYYNLPAKTAVEPPGGVLGKKQQGLQPGILDNFVYQGGHVTLPTYKGHVESDTHDPSIKLPQGSKITPEAWKRFGKLDQERYIYLQGKFGAWSATAGKSKLAEVLGSLNSQIRAKVKEAHDAQKGSTSSAFKYMSLKSANNMSLADWKAAAATADPTGKFDSWAEAINDGFLRQEEVSQWDLYNRVGEPDIILNHTGSGSWENQYIKAGKPIGGGTSWSYVAGTWHEHHMTMAAVPIHTITMSYFTPVSASHYSEKELGPRYNLMFDPDEVLFTSASDKSKINNLTGSKPVGGSWMDKIRVALGLKKLTPIESYNQLTKKKASELHIGDTFREAGSFKDRKVVSVYNDGSFTDDAGHYYPATAKVAFVTNGPPGKDIAGKLQDIAAGDPQLVMGQKIYNPDGSLWGYVSTATSDYLNKKPVSADGTVGEKIVVKYPETIHTVLKTQIQNLEPGDQFYVPGTKGKSIGTITSVGDNVKYDTPTAKGNYLAAASEVFPLPKPDSAFTPPGPPPKGAKPFVPGEPTPKTVQVAQPLPKPEIDEHPVQPPKPAPVADDAIHAQVLYKQPVGTWVFAGAGDQNEPYAWISQKDPSDGVTMTYLDGHTAQFETTAMGYVLKGKPTTVKAPAADGPTGSKKAGKLQVGDLVYSYHSGNYLGQMVGFEEGPGGKAIIQLPGGGTKLAGLNSSVKWAPAPPADAPNLDAPQNVEQKPDGPKVDVGSLEPGDAFVIGDPSFGLDADWDVATGHVTKKTPDGEAVWVVWDTGPASGTDKEIQFQTGGTDFTVIKTGHSGAGLAGDPPSPEPEPAVPDPTTPEGEYTSVVMLTKGDTFQHGGKWWTVVLVGGAGLYAKDEDGNDDWFGNDISVEKDSPSTPDVLQDMPTDAAAFGALKEMDGFNYYGTHMTKTGPTTAVTDHGTEQQIDPATPVNGLSGANDEDPADLVQKPMGDFHVGETIYVSGGKAYGKVVAGNPEKAGVKVAWVAFEKPDELHYIDPEIIGGWGYPNEPTDEQLSPPPLTPEAGALQLKQKKAGQLSVGDAVYSYHSEKLIGTVTAVSDKVYIQTPATAQHPAGEQKTQGLKSSIKTPAASAAPSPPAAVPISTFEIGDAIGLPSSPDKPLAVVVGYKSGPSGISAVLATTHGEPWTPGNGYTFTPDEYYVKVPAGAPGVPEVQLGHGTHFTVPTADTPAGQPLYAPDGVHIGTLAYVNQHATGYFDTNGNPHEWDHLTLGGQAPVVNILEKPGDPPGTAPQSFDPPPVPDQPVQYEDVNVDDVLTVQKAAAQSFVGAHLHIDEVTPTLISGTYRDGPLAGQKQTITPEQWKQVTFTKQSSAPDLFDAGPGGSTLGPLTAAADMVPGDYFVGTDGSSMWQVEGHSMSGSVLAHQVDPENLMPYEGALGGNQVFTHTNFQKVYPTGDQSSAGDIAPGLGVHPQTAIGDLVTGTELYTPSGELIGHVGSGDPVDDTVSVEFTDGTEDVYPADTTVAEIAADHTTTPQPSGVFVPPPGYVETKPSEFQVGDAVYELVGHSVLEPGSGTLVYKGEAIDVTSDSVSIGIPGGSISHTDASLTRLYKPVLEPEAPSAPPEPSAAPSAPSALPSAPTGSKKGKSLVAGEHVFSYHSGKYIGTYNGTTVGGKKEIDTPDGGKKLVGPNSSVKVAPATAPQAADVAGATPAAPNIPAAAPPAAAPAPSGPPPNLTAGQVHPVAYSDLFEGEWVYDYKGNLIGQVVGTPGENEQGHEELWIKGSDGLVDTWDEYDQPTLYRATGSTTAAEPPQPKAVGVVMNWDQAGIQIKPGKGIGGTQGSLSATDQYGGKYSLKTYGGNEDRARVEAVANAIYQAVGVPVPQGGLTKYQGKDAYMASWVDGAPHKINKKTEGDVLGEGFMADALVANWDVIGLEDDNIIWGDDGTPYRVDTGGSLHYRAQGGLKDFGPIPHEVKVMMGKGRQAERTMNVTEEQEKAQAAHIGEVLTDALIDSIVDSAYPPDSAEAKMLRAALKGRVQWMRDFAEGKAKVEDL